MMQENERQEPLIQIESIRGSLAEFRSIERLGWVRDEDRDAWILVENGKVLVTRDEATAQQDPLGRVWT